MSTQQLFEAYSTNKFKDTLFESVSHEPWSLDFKILAYELRKELEPILTEWVQHIQTICLLAEAETTVINAQDVFTKFVQLGKINRNELDSLHKQVSMDTGSSKGQSLFARLFAPLGSKVDKINRMKEYPQTQEQVSREIDRIQSKVSGKVDEPTQGVISRVLKSLVQLAKKGGWVGPVVALAVGTLASLISIPFIPQKLILLGVVASTRLVVGLVKGETWRKSMAKAAAVFGLGLATSALADWISPMITSALAATPPAHIDGGTWHEPPADSAGTDTTEPEIPPSDNARTWRVQQGDTLGAIAQKMNVSAQELVDANPDITDPNKINPGQTLNVPAETDPTGKQNIWRGWRGRARGV